MRCAIKKHIGKLLLSLILLGAVGCSKRYGLEREIYHISQRLRPVIASGEDMTDAEYEKWSGVLRLLERTAKDRDLDIPVRRMRILLALAKGKAEDVKSLVDYADPKKRVELYWFTFNSSLRFRRWDLAFWILDKAEKAIENEQVRYSFPFLRCLVGAKMGQEGLCDSAEQFYSALASAEDAKKRFVGRRGLFLTALARGEGDKAIKELEAIILDDEIPLAVKLANLRTEIALLLRAGKVDVVKEVVENFEKRNKDRLDEKTLSALDGLLAKIKQLSEKKADESAGLPNR